MVGETSSSYVPEDIRPKGPQQIEFGDPNAISDTDRQRAAVATAFILDDTSVPRVEGVGIAPAPNGSKRGAGPSVFVVTYSSNPGGDLQEYTLPKRKDVVAENVGRRISGGGLKRFAQSIYQESPQFQSARVKYHQKDARRELDRDPNKPALVVVTDRQTKAMTTFAICWTQQEAERTLHVWQEEQSQRGLGEPRVANMSLPQRSEVAPDEIQHRQSRKKLSLPGMQNLHAALRSVSKRRAGN